MLKVIRQYKEQMLTRNDFEKGYNRIGPDVGYILSVTKCFILMWKVN